MRPLRLLSVVLLVACGRAVPDAVDAGTPEVADGSVDVDAGRLADADTGAADDAGTLDDAGTADDAGTSGDAGAMDAGGFDAGTPTGDGGLRVPPPFPTYAGTCPTLVSAPLAMNARNRAFMSRGDAREFLLLVPPTYTPTRRYPVVFGYHWLNASANSVVRDAQLESAVAQYDFIAVVPENLETRGMSAYRFNWPFVETMFAPKELGFFEDLLACVSQQFNVDASRVHVFGASAGGLWTAYLSTTPAVNRVASVLTISGGLGEENLTGLWRTDFVPQPTKFPALVVWGGSTDFFILNFDRASRRYRDALRADNHFVAQCVHSSGHGIPPFPQPSDGGTKFAPFWEFFRDHPYGLAPNASPYRQSGLPPSFPSLCSILP
jgi:hypothetical protein